MDKLEQLRSFIAQKHLDGVIVLSEYNRRYLSGFTGTSGALLITKEDQYLITDFRYIEQATSEAPAFHIINRQNSLIQSLKEQINTLNLQNIGFEGNLVSYDEYLQLSKSYVSLISISGAIEKIREVKNPTEIEIIQNAANIVDQAYEYILTVAKSGMTEQQLKAKLESKLLELGAEGTSFSTIVASGHRGALPHGVASDKIIEQGDMITLDFGAYYQGYASDITRTFAIGEPNPKLKEIYNIVLAANQKAIEAAKAGISSKALDAVARDYIAKQGYGEAFGHSLGHGIGLDVHEGPVLAKNTDSALQVNNCVTIEPGIYIDGLGGVRIEDDILITENGCQRFTNSTKDLIIL
ncbi:aminopeptidase P family protein [Staphylococcus arlettae]|uniref:M24 family metallopeptidase n=1 Tax=Staphylococcus arlettae TaxID=29378 RepID=UPI0010726B3C|nr:aminopeptidase P family protein [Staphylococcus arlettae]MBF0737607.1 aminopeptidase P family protein [Staphylococcus arlettae]TFU47689.1 aminopeptidase P family protein [Staphylococcus arlettae]